jgi:transposase
MSDPGDARPEVYDDGKKIVDRKRHIVVDTDGPLLMVNLTATDIFDSAGARIDYKPRFKVLPRRWVVERTFGWMAR